MSIAKPFTFVANTYAKASEVNADFDTVYAQVNSNISSIAQNANDIDNLENNKANINGSTSQRFAVADAVSNGDAINKQTLFKQIGNVLDFISGFIITKDSGSPEDTIIVSEGSAYDSTKTVVLSLSEALSKQNTTQAANTTYYVYIIGTATGAQTDILISPSQTAPGLPSGYTLYRQIGYYTTNDDNEISTIAYYGNDSNRASAAISYTSGDSGFRIYPDGWCEQWGLVEATPARGPVEITFLKEFANTNYDIQLSVQSDRTGHMGGGCINPFVCSSLKQKDKMSISEYAIANFSYANEHYYWKTSGYLAEGEY